MRISIYSLTCTLVLCVSFQTASFCMQQPSPTIQAIAAAKVQFDHLYTAIKEAHNSISMTSSIHPAPENMPQTEDHLFIATALIDKIETGKKRMDTIWQLTTAHGYQCPEALAHNHILPTLHEQIRMAQEIQAILSKLYQVIEHNHIILKSKCEESC